MAAATVPVVEDLYLVYGEGTVAAQQRFQELKDAFTDRFGSAPELYARAPGRVNIIGEHIDYEGYAVLPMAIAQDTVVAIRRGGEELVVTNLNSKKYPEAVFSVDPTQAVNTASHSWANYFLAAYKGVFEYLSSKGDGLAPSPVGLQVMLHGLVPTGSGLSSSAAFTCSVSSALLGILGGELNQAEMAEFTCKCERYVGTESGGMDQAISIMAMPGAALKVDFNPVRVEKVQLPAGATFVVANSLTVSNKAETAHARYNMRVVECRLAAAVLAIALGTSKGAALKIETLKEVEAIIAGKLTGPKGEVTNANIAAVHEHLHEGAYTQAEVEEILGTTLDQLLDGHANQLRVLPIAAQSGGFQLRKRAEHVYSESVRVLQYQDICSSTQEDAEKLLKLGRLMDESQASCRDLYECSCPELDSLVGICKEAGAIGSRLTGAGWGGCTVSLVYENAVDAFIATVKQQYYSPLVKSGSVKEEELDECIFASKPSTGAAVLKLAKCTV